MSITTNAINKTNGQIFNGDDIAKIDNNFKTLQDAINNLPSGGSGLTPEQEAQLDKIGDLTTLTTTDKTSLVNAIKENSTQLSDMTNQIVTTPTANKLLKLDSNSKLPTSITGDADSIDGIQGNQIPLKTLADITYYVNVTTGLDTNTGLASGTAFKTIAKAISLLPQIINNTVTINVASGTYPEDPVLNGFNGKGKIIITGGTSYADSANYMVTSFTVQNCGIEVDIIGFRCVSTKTYGSNFAGINSNYVKFDKCSVITNGIATYTRAIYSGAGANVFVSNSNFVNQFQAMLCENMGQIYSDVNVGSGNSIGLCTQMGGLIIKSGGTQPSGTTAEQSNNGGVIR